MWRMPFTIAVNLPRLPKILETMHRMIDRPDQYSEQDKYDYVRYITSLMRKTGFIRTDGFGMENLPKEGGYILYPNHQGKFDAYSIVTVHEGPLSIVMDREMSYFVLINEIIDILRGKRMDIKDARQGLTVIRQVAAEVKEGRRYIIFPEGAYDNQKRNRLWDFKPGSFKAATKAGVPIIPVALVDSYQVYNSWRIAPVRTQVHFLEPLFSQDYQDMTTTQIATLVKDRIQTKLSQLGFEA